MSITKLAVVALLIAAVGAQEESFEGMFTTAVKFVNACGNKDLMVCLKERALKYLDNAQGNVELVEGITLKETNPEEKVPEEEPTPLPEEPRAREDAVDNLIMNRVANFLSTHTLEFRMPQSALSDMKRSLDVEEGRKKKKKLLLPLLILLKLKAAMLIPLALKAIALIAFKALIIGKIALLISGIIALKKLLASKHSHESYEVVAHPHYSHSHASSIVDDHHHEHYRRALEVDPHSLPYSAYVNNQDKKRA